MPTERYIRMWFPGQPRLADLGPIAQPLAPSVADMLLELKDLDADGLAVDIQDPHTTVTRAGIPMSLIGDVPTATTAAAASAWGLAAVGALASGRTGKGITVAVLDTGCDTNHEAFAKLKARGAIVEKDFTRPGQPASAPDDHGHGTHCAGTICGGEVNGQRIGVAPGIHKLLVGKVLGPGGGTNDMILDAMFWAASNGAQIISMSLGIDFPGWVEALAAQGLPRPAATSRALHDYRTTVEAFDKLASFLQTRNVLVVAASGNESARSGPQPYTIDVAPPAAAPEIFSVGAVGRRPDGTFFMADFSNTGPNVVAPGVDVLSARRGGGLVAMSGTSMATPHVAGLAALWGEELKDNGQPLTRANLRRRLEANATVLPGIAALDQGNGLTKAP